MNTANLKTFAPAARNMLLDAVKNRALKVGVSPTRVEPVTVEGEFVRIGGIRHPRRIADLRTKLLAKINRDGFESVMEEAAYTWFNRLVAIRYMEVRGYLKHGYRVLSSSSKAVTPEILSQAQNVNLSGLDGKRVLELLADGAKQEELYQLLLLAQCHELSDSMPFLFDRIDGASELLTPDGLLASDSIIRKIVKDIPEADWQTTEILGWLYQFYVSDEKARVDAYVKSGKAVEPADIPAKTQLFTPNWIVQFMVQNSLGRLWMDVYPTSDLRSKMPYYCPPAHQEPEVEQQLKAITPLELDPTKLTAIDPAAGSGHILLELYNLFFEMYREQGYLPTEIPRQIVERNLFGLELDRRAAQIAGFAVLMRARRDDPKLLENPPKVNVIPLRHSRNLDLHILLGDSPREPIVPYENLFDEAAVQPKLTIGGRPLMSDPKLVRELCQLFNDADTEGSLIRVPEQITKMLGVIESEIATKTPLAGLYAQEALSELVMLVHQARLLSSRYSICVANPPYMGGKGQCKALKEFLKEKYLGFEKDVFAAFFIRGQELTEPNGYVGFMSPFTWMFISTFDELRRHLIESSFFCSLVQLEYSGFEGATVPICTLTLRNTRVKGEKGTYIRLSVFKGAENQSPRTLEAVANPNCEWLYHADQEEFKKLPGCPIAYWLLPEVLHYITNSATIGDTCFPQKGLVTLDDAKFIRRWQEVSRSEIELFADSRETARMSGASWFPINNGGGFLRWYGYRTSVINWRNDGSELKAHIVKKYGGGSYTKEIRNESSYFKPCITWTKIGSAKPSFRFVDKGFLFSDAGYSLFSQSDNLDGLLAWLNCDVSRYILAAYSPTLNLSTNDIARVPIPPKVMFAEEVVGITRRAVSSATDIWDLGEESWDFKGQFERFRGSSATEWYAMRVSLIESLWSQVQDCERLINEIANEAIGLPREFSLFPKSAGSTQQIVPAANEIKKLLSYFIGNLMGRYSIDEPGLAYAGKNNGGFDAERFQSFSPDPDGIIPITDKPYFGERDCISRLLVWLQSIWPRSAGENDLAFIADAVGCRANETPLEAIHRYFADEFYGDHLQTYKKRPIYWMFASGKKKAFQALVYLHRYNSSTLSRMRSDYVGPLIRMLQAQVDEAKSAETAATLGSQKTAAAKVFKKLSEQLEELLEFDKRLHHYALEQIELDLDDGVKVNYGKFSDPKVGDILAKVKEITGGKDD